MLFENTSRQLLSPDAASGGAGASSSGSASSGTPSAGVVGGGAESSASLGQADSAPSAGLSDGVQAEEIELSDNWDEPGAPADAQDARGEEDKGTDAPADAGEKTDAADEAELSDSEADRLLSEWIASQIDPQPDANSQAKPDVVGKIEPKADAKPDAKADAKPVVVTPPAEVEALYTAVESELSQPAAKAFRTLVDGLRTQVEQIKSELTTEREAQKQTREQAETTQKYLAWKKETLPAVEHIDKLMEGDPRFGLAAKLARDEVTAEQFRPYTVLHKLAMGIQEQAKREGRELSVEAIAKAAASRMRRMHGQKPTGATAPEKSAVNKPGDATKFKLPPPKQPAPKSDAAPRVESEAEFLANLRNDLSKFS